MLKSCLANTSKTRRARDSSRRWSRLRPAFLSGALWLFAFLILSLGCLTVVLAFSRRIRHSIDPHEKTEGGYDKKRIPPRFFCDSSSDRKPTKSCISLSVSTNDRNAPLPLSRCDRTMYLHVRGTHASSDCTVPRSSRTHGIHPQALCNQA